MAKTNIPKHIAFIMDGNGRWAKKRLLPRKIGHREGVKAMKNVIKACRDLGVEVVSFYAFSTENWSRPKDEVDALFSLVKKFAQEEMREYVKDNYIVRFMGDISKLPKDVNEALNDILQSSKDNDGMVVNIGLNYGGRDEIAYAVKELIRLGEEPSVENISKHLYTAGLPDPEIIVRSSGEERLSNFMLFQAAYSELIFMPQLWPDFDADTIDKIIEEFNRRERRFGKVVENA